MQKIMFKLALSRINARKKCVSKSDRFQFTDTSEIICSIKSNNAYFSENFIRRNPIDKGIMCCTDMAIDGVLTERTDRTDRGILHKEGGWPKDISLNNLEQVDRFRKKLEKGEEYSRQILQGAEYLEECVIQNNIMNIYQTYFDDLEPPPFVECPEYRTINLYRDTSHFRRRVNHFSWSPDQNSKLCISHCDNNFLRMPLKSPIQSESYIWDILKPNTPYIKLLCDYPMMGLEYSQKDPNSLVSGLTSGQVASWDIRIGRNPVAMSDRSVSHRDFVNSVLWNNSKTGTEFFSGGNDGQVIWWDTRNLKQHLQSLLMDPVKTDDQVLNRSYGVTVLEYDPSIPTKFMCGTQQGYVFTCNRKGKAPSEKINSKIQTHVGPVLSLIRNPFYVKSYLTTGDWSGKIWVEECRESSIVTTQGSISQVTDGVWSLTKASRFYLSRQNGMFECYDTLQRLTEPVLSVKVCDESISTLKPHMDGNVVAIGTSKGVSYIAQITDNASVNCRNDKMMMTNMMERETKREKLLETKLREAKLKVRVALKLTTGKTGEMSTALVQKNAEELIACKSSEKDLFDSIDREMKYRDGTLVRPFETEKVERRSSY